jgi:shikimate kinase
VLKGGESIAVVEIPFVGDGACGGIAEIGNLGEGRLKKVLLTGISGVGKSTLTEALAVQGYKSIDADSDEYSEWVEVSGGSDEYGSTVEPNRDWVWREDRIETLLATEDAEILFLSGCAANMRRFLPQFDHIILVSAPDDVIVERLATRTNNIYGKDPNEVERILSQKQTIEPRLRAIAHHEIDTNAPLDHFVSRILSLTL